MPENAQIILALDNDEGGYKLFEAIQALFSPLKGVGRVFIRDMPRGGGQDWNDLVRPSNGD